MRICDGWNHCVRCCGTCPFVGTNDTSVVTAYDDTAILKVVVHQDKYGKFQGNGIGPTNISAIHFPSQCEDPCIPFIAKDNADPPVSGGIDPEVRVK